MKRQFLKLSGLTLSSLLMFACASNAGGSGVANSLKVSSDENYVYIIDYEKMGKYEQAYKASMQAVDNIWVNPPTKKITHAEYEALIEQTKQE